MAVHPNFFMVGAAKSGTTSLWMYLKQHPSIYMPQNSKFKEPAYYCPQYGMTGIEEYLALFAGVRDETAIGEASTAYLSTPESAGLIHAACPDARIIIVLRNPVERAYSLYRWMVNHGYEWLYPFEKALEMEAQRKADTDFFSSSPENFYNYMYFHSSLYSAQVRRYLDTFSADRVKILLLEDLQSDPRAVARELYAFLGVDASFEPQVGVYNRAELRPLCVRMHFALNMLRRRHRHTRIDTAASMLFEANMRLLRLKWPPIDEQTRRSLLDAYRADIRQTAALIGRDLSSWLQ